MTAANDTDSPGNATYFVLSFGGEVTGPILANANGSCEPAASEVQVISTSTSGESTYDDLAVLCYILHNASVRTRMMYFMRICLGSDATGRCCCSSLVTHGVVRLLTFMLPVF